MTIDVRLALFSNIVVFLFPVSQMHENYLMNVVGTFQYIIKGVKVNGRILSTIKYRLICTGIVHNIYMFNIGIGVY